ncbi:MAG: tripartite tricarboxylate transporter substrate binding protein [Burkholderiales bacterium]|nr:tripartite tricarboxylate transporter substrate binding protein [Burkholderiales bacterium]MDP2397302.1 tripartite tricarboxylate transporter substrate binding protein [Burkholderiales bacterium]
MPVRPVAARLATSREFALKTGTVLLLGGGLLFAATAALAQSWPVKPVRMIVPFATGGGTDIQARLFSAKLQPLLGQQVIVDNRTGAGGNIGAELVAKSSPDGYTVLFQSASLAVNATLYRKLNYNAIRDLAPVMLVSSTPLILVVHPSVPAKNVKELIALAKARPGVFNFGSNSTGTTSHLASELLKTMTGTKMTHVPYKGAGQAVIALASGEIDMLITTIAAAQPHMESGRMRALAVTTLKRTPSLPNLPTVDETLKGFESDNWYGLFFPAKTPEAIVSRLHAEMSKVLTDPDVRKLMENQGATPLASSPAEMTAYLKSEIEKYAKVIQASGARAD